MRVAVGVGAEFNQGEDVLHALAAFVSGDFLHAQAEGDVLRHRQVGEQCIALEHHADAAFLRGKRQQILPVEDYLTAIDRCQAGDAAQQRGLAAAGRAEQGDEFAPVDFAVDVTEYRGGGVLLVQAANAQVTHVRSLFRRLAAQVQSTTKLKYEITSALLKWPLLLRMLLR